MKKNIFNIILLFAVIIFSFYSCIEKEESIPPKRELAYYAANLNWKSTESFSYPGMVIFDILYTSKTFTLWKTRNELIYFNGKSLQVIYSAGKNSIAKAEISEDKKHLIIGEHSPEYTIRILYAPFDTSEGVIQLDKIIEIDNLVTENILALKNIANNKFILLGTMEYQIITVVPQKTPYFINKHYTIDLNPGFDINLVSNPFNKDILLYSKDAIYQIDSTDNYSSLKKRIDFPEPILKEGSIKYPYNSYLLYCFGDLDWGIFRRNEKFYIYTKTDPSYEFSVADSLTVDRKIKISPLECRNFSLSQSCYLFCSINGSIIRKNLSDKSNFGNNWETIVTLPKSLNYPFSYINDKKLLAALDSLYVIEPIIKEEQKPKEVIENKKLFFVLEKFPITSSIYGIGIADFNGDNNDEIYAVDIYDNNRFFNHLPSTNDPYLSNVTAKYGLEGRKNEKGVFDLDLAIATGDIDESGSEDIITTYLEGPNSLYINNGNSYFRDCTEEYGLNKDINRSESACLGDIDNDGYLDHFAASYLFTNRLFINDNGIKFIERTNESGVRSHYGSITAIMGDVNNDGYSDIYLCNWQKENKLYLNNRDGTFKDFTIESGTSGGSMKRSNSAIFADFDNDGDLDLFVGNRGTGNNLFLNDGAGIFKDVTETSGLIGKFFTYGAVAADFNNDTYLDLAFTDSKNILLYINKGIKNGIPVFEQYKNGFQSITLDSEISGSFCGMAYFDNLNDGDIDLLIGQSEGRLQLLNNLLINNYNNNNFIEIKVYGSESNRSGIGTKIYLYKGDKLIGFRELCSNSGYASSSSKIIHFGIGEEKGILKLVTYFPKSNSRIEQYVTAGSRYEIHEHSGITEFFYISSKNIKRLLYSDTFIWECVKLFFLIPLFLFFVVMIKLKFVQNSAPFFSNINRNQYFILASICLTIYFLSATIINIVMIIYPNYSDWISNTRNIFLRDFLPFLISFAAIPVSLIFLKNSESKKFTKLGTLDKLLEKLQSFYHGEASAMNLNRISLFMKNLSSIDFHDKEIRERFKLIIEEFSGSTYNSLIEITECMILLRFDQNFKTVETQLKQTAKEIALNSKSLKISLANPELTKGKIDSGFFIDLLESIKRSILDLIRIIHSQINCSLDEVIEQLKNKYAETQSLQYQFIIKNELEHITRLFIQRDELEKCLSILIQNSIEAFAKDNSGTNIISLSAYKKNGKVLLSISDNGIGIKEKDIANIFQKGFTTKPNGHGFGLFYVKETIIKYYGKISIQSNEDKGTTVVVEIKIIS